MKPLTSTLLLLVASSGVSAVPTVPEVICETSDGSPYLHHVNELIDGLTTASQNGFVCLDYSLGSPTCGPTSREYSGTGGAAWQFCKHGDGQVLRCNAGDPGGGICITCQGIRPISVAGWISKLRDDCARPDSNGDIRVGGIHRIKGGGEVRLYSMPG